MQKLLSETALCWHRLEVVFVLREILRHRDQFSSNVIPVLQQHRGRPHRWLRRSFFLHRVLRGCECPENSDSKNHTCDLLLHSPISPGDFSTSIRRSPAFPGTVSVCACRWTALPASHPDHRQSSWESPPPRTSRLLFVQDRAIQG